MPTRERAAREKAAAAPTDPLAEAAAAAAAADPLAASSQADGDAAPDAPKRGRGRPAGSRTRANLAPRLQELIAFIGVGVSVANPADGAAILEGAEGLAKALDALARENPAVRRALEGLLTGSAYGGVVLALLPIVARIAANHGALPPAVAMVFGAPMPTPMPPEGGTGDGDPVASNGAAARVG